jgi:hypothetical protein
LEAEAAGERSKMKTTVLTRADVERLNTDPTEAARRDMVQELNEPALSDADQERARLEAIHGKGNVWSTDEIGDRFEVVSFMAPFVSVRDKKTGEKGYVQFVHYPRFYFGYEKK